VLLRQKGEQNLIKDDETDQSLMKTDARLRDNSGATISTNIVAAEF
jgi:hypothetical protein